MPKETMITQDFFPVSREAVLDRVNRINPVLYGRTRNFIDGDITYLSPYISRGFIYLTEIRDRIIKNGYTTRQSIKFLQELAWREFFQRTWWRLGDRIFSDIRQSQQEVAHFHMPAAITAAQTGIQAVDQAIRQLYRTGYVHNHARMYIAGITCNIARAHWKTPAAWMYYHLLDGDLASNTCSWQWVAGSFSAKKYIASQENINHYLHDGQTGSFLDLPYDMLLRQPIPEVLRPVETPLWQTPLPVTPTPVIDPSLPILLYNHYHLHPGWRADMKANRVLVLDPDHFSRFPVSEKVLGFITALAKENLPGIQVHAGAPETIPHITGHPEVYSLEHPLGKQYPGKKDPYPWLFPQVTGYHPSFFSFWKKAERWLE